MTEAQPNPLQTVIDEFKTLSPEIMNALVFKGNGQTIASAGSANEDQTKKLILNFGGIAQQAQVIGGVESLTIQAADNQLNITSMNSLYLATFSSREANPEITKSLTQVVVPTVVRLIDQIGSVPPENQPPQTVEIQEPSIQESVPTQEEPTIEPAVEAQPAFQPLPPSTPINQFMVEKIGGLLAPSDTVRIDGEVIAKWSEHYGGKQITTVNIEALDGKKTTCKVKPIKDAKTNSKGVIQIPDKILQTLQTEKGKLVMVKPVVD